MKFVNMTASKSASELESNPKARLRMNHDKTPLPAANPPRVKPDPFAPKVKDNKPPVRIASPAKSTVRGDAKSEAEPSNAEILDFLRRNFPSLK